MSAHPSAHEEPVASAVAVSEAPTPVVSLRRIAGLVALAAAAATLTGYSNPQQLVQSYLPAFLLWFGVSIGCLSMLMIQHQSCLLYTSPSPRDRTRSRMPSSA